MDEVNTFVFDDENEEKFASHGLTIEEVDQALGNPHVVVRNRRGRRSPLLVIGRTDGGACIAVPIEGPYHGGAWRPVTAWSCKDSEMNALRRSV